MDLIMTQPTNELEQTLQKIAKLNSMYWKHLGKKHTNCPTCGVDPNILLDWLLAHDKEIDRQARIDKCVKVSNKKLQNYKKYCS